MAIRSEILKENLQRVRARIEAAARAAGRAPEEITLVVVTKGHPVDAVEEIIEAGAQVLGESYAEEGQAKLQHIEAGVRQALDVQWHMVGHVQSRKAEIVAAHFELLHSLDNLKLARRLDKFAGEAERRLPVLLQINVSGEASKYGWPAGKESDWPALEAEVEDILEMANLHIAGLMTIPPIVPDPEEARPFFARTRDLRDRLAARFPAADWGQLSMGMSADFEAAIHEGATLVRVGTAIMGPRPQK
jgi:hypothetical protein